MKGKIIALTAVVMMLSGCGHVIAPDSGANVSEFTAVPISTAVQEPAFVPEPESTPASWAAPENESAPAPYAVPESEATPASSAVSEPATTSKPKPVDDVASDFPSAPTPASSAVTENEAAPASTSVQEIAATDEPAHICSWDNGSVTKAATCTDEGEKTYTCIICGKRRTENIAKSDHHIVWQWHLDEDLELGNCMIRHRIVDICSDCGYILNTYSDDTEPGHVLGDPVWEEGFTCTSAITYTQSCIRCGAVCNTQTVGPTGHKPESCGSGNCSICGAHVEHQWADGQCYCGAVQEISGESQ